MNAYAMLLESTLLAIVKTLPTTRDKALVSLLASTGCRLSEALQLRFSDVDMVAKTVTLFPRKLGWTTRTSNEFDAMKLSLNGALADYFFISLSKYNRQEYKSPWADSALIFPNLPLHYTKQGLSLGGAQSTREAFLDAMRKAGIKKDITRHGLNSLRHLSQLAMPGRVP